MATLDHSPSPNHSISSGRKTSRGVALNAVMNGSSMALSVLERPSKTPSGRPARIASPSPTAKAAALTPSGAQIEPVANICHSVPAISLGTVKNSLVPAFMGMRSGRNCQTRRRSTMLPAPSAVGSMRRHSRPAGAAASAGPAVAKSAWSSAMTYCPARHGKALRSAKRMPSVSTTAITITVRMQANILSMANRSP